MAELNFTTPLGNQRLNFGADDYEGYLKFVKTFELDYKQFPIIYCEFEWKYALETNVARFLRFRVVSNEGVFITKASTPFLKYNESTFVSLVLDLTEYKHLDLIINSEIYVEEIVEGSDILGIDNLRIYIGKPNE